jgi:GNAT superfamily N-acetyltransferase
VRPLLHTDQAAWRPLWDGYNAFYGRAGETALPEDITLTTWQRFFDPAEPVFCMVAEAEGELLGLVHYLFHRSTTMLNATCYLQDLFTRGSARGHGVGRALIQAVYARAAEVRGAWDARLEALVVDALVRGDVDDALRSRIAALGWSGRGSTLVVVGTTSSALDDVRAAELRRATRRVVRQGSLSRAPPLPGT